MDIMFKNRKLRKACADTKTRIREFGPVRASLIGRRLDELAAAENLEVMRSLPRARCHELRQNRAGQLSVDLDHPYRLLFVVANDPVPCRADGGLDWQRVTALEIIGVEDTHE